MYAVIYSPAPSLAELIQKGADPNRQNDAGATPLMWAVTDLEKTRILLDHRADVNARSADLRTPLLIAAGRPGGSKVVKLLLDRGAKVEPNQNPAGESSPLLEAATAGDVESMQLLLAHGASAKAAGQPAIAMAITVQCMKCLDLLLTGKPDKAVLSGALGEIAMLGDVSSTRRLLDLGADVNAVDPPGRTPLLYAAGSDLVPLDLVKLLVERGANVNAKVGHPNAVDTGWSVLDVAKLRGNTPVVDFLVKAGAKGTAMPAPVLKAKQGNTVAAAVQASIPMLQRADVNFVPKATCASCHNNSLAAMTMGLVRKSGFRVDEASAARQVQANVFGLDKMRDNLQQGFFVVPIEGIFGPVVVSYMLVGLDAEHYPADLNTDMAARYLKMNQMPDGQWAYWAADTRPPLGSDYMGQTALSMRALQLYALVTEKPAYQKSVDLAAAWIAKTKPLVNDDRSWRVLGLAWSGKYKDALQSATKELAGLQRADGGWSDLPTMESSVYSTGKALVALQAAGLPVSDAVYQRGVKYLLNNQQEDGTWYVKTRALAFQPYFDAGFSHGRNQFISAAGSNWATMALALAAPGGTATKR